MNLVGNAIKFTESGEVVLNARVESRSSSDVVLHFSVTDTGIGIPAAKQQQIFEAFAQADSSTTRKYGGTGLGLSISSQLSELMNGRIWVESEVARGSTFHFTAQFGLQRTAIEAPEPVPVTLRDLPVLVVDDSSTSRQILEEMLTNWKMKAVTANGAAEAIETLKSAQKSGHPFHLVIADGRMPEMDGFDLVARIRQNPRSSRREDHFTDSGRAARRSRAREKRGSSICSDEAREAIGTVGRDCDNIARYKQAQEASFGRARTGTWQSPAVARSGGGRQSGESGTRDSSA